MAQATRPQLSGLRIDELEAHYPAYCKAMRLLVRGGASVARVRRTVCWERLALLQQPKPPKGLRELRRYGGVFWDLVKARPDLDLTPYANVQATIEAVRARPAYQRAMAQP